MVESEIFFSNDSTASRITYSVQATLAPNPEVIEVEMIRAGRFILATNVLDAHQLSADDVLTEYKDQQSNERGFRFLKDPLFFTSSVFVKSPKRVEALVMVMGLCLLVYSLAQRQLRQALAQAGEGIKNQVGKLTERPTLRWVFECVTERFIQTIEREIATWSSVNSSVGIG